MFGLFRKKQDNEAVTSKTSQEQDNSSPDTTFNFAILPDDKKIENVYLYDWLKNDGEWVE